MSTKDKIIDVQNYIKNKHDLNIFDQQDFLKILEDKSIFKDYLYEIFNFKDTYRDKMIKHVIKICYKHNENVDFEPNTRYYPYNNKKNYENFLYYFILKYFFDNTTIIENICGELVVNRLDSIKGFVENKIKNNKSFGVGMKMYRFNITEHTILFKNIDLNILDFNNIDKIVEAIETIGDMICNQTIDNFYNKLKEDLIRYESEFELLDYFDNVSFETNIKFYEFCHNTTSSIKLNDKTMFIKKGKDVAYSSYVYYYYIPFIFYKNENNLYDILSFSGQKYLNNDHDNIFLLKHL